MTDAPKVWHINDPSCPSDAVYCGRVAYVGPRGLRHRIPTSPYHNPFRIGSDNGRYVSRDEACDRFDAEILPTLDVTPLRGKHLKCWCAPLRCHCDSILRKASASDTSGQAKGDTP